MQPHAFRFTNAHSRVHLQSDLPVCSGRQHLSGVVHSVEMLRRVTDFLRLTGPKFLGKLCELSNLRNILGCLDLSPDILRLASFVDLGFENEKK